MAKAKAGRLAAPPAIGDKSYAATALSAMMTSPRTCPQLPTELWSEVLQYLADPYDLWVSCRQVSSAFKIEAERAFRIQFLPCLKVEWRPVDRLVNEFFVVAELDEAISDPKSSSAFFNLHTKDRYFVLNSLNAEDRVASLRNLIDRDDIDAIYRKADKWTYGSQGHVMRACFEHLRTPNNYANDVEIPDLKLHLALTPAKTLSADQDHMELNWKRLLTVLFAEEIYVRQKIAAAEPWNAQATLQSAMARTKGSVRARNSTYANQSRSLAMSTRDEQPYLNVKADFIKDFVAARVAEHMRAYGEAYQHRLRKAYANIGLDPPWEADKAYAEFQQFRSHVRAHVHRLQAKEQDRRKGSYRILAETYWDRNFSHMVFEQGLGAPQHPMAIKKVNRPLGSADLVRGDSYEGNDEKYIISRKSGKSKSEVNKRGGVAVAERGHQPKRKSKKKAKRWEDCD